MSRATWFDVFLASMLCLSVGCMDYSWVHPMRATEQAVAPEYAAYVSSDQTLTQEQKTRRLRTLEGWDRFLDQAEKEAGMALPGSVHEQ